MPTKKKTPVQEPNQGKEHKSYLRLQIAGVNLDISNHTANAYNNVEKDWAYRDFLQALAEPGKKMETNTDTLWASLEVAVQVQTGTLPAVAKFENKLKNGGSWSLYKEGDTYYVLRQPPAFEVPIWIARFGIDPAASGVTVFCNEKFNENPVRYPLDLVLMMYILAPRHGVIIHSAGLSIDGRGFIFPGVSEAGKSTLSRQFNGYEGGHNPIPIQRFSDDRMIARKINGSFYAYGAPWSGTERIGLNGNAALAAFLFLKHGPTNRVERLSPQQALERFMAVTSIPWYDKTVLPSILDTVGELVLDVPCFDFYFKPGSEVVNFLENFKP